MGFFVVRLGTKAETLERMYGKLNTAKVLPQFTFTVAEWEYLVIVEIDAFSKVSR